MNSLAHTKASTQGNFSPPGAIPKHFASILFKYAGFSTLYYTLSWLQTRKGVLYLREMPA